VDKTIKTENPSIRVVRGGGPPLLKRWGREVGRDRECGRRGSRGRGGKAKVKRSLLFADSVLKSTKMVPRKIVQKP